MKSVVRKIAIGIGFALPASISSAHHEAATGIAGQPLLVVMIALLVACGAIALQAKR